MWWEFKLLLSLGIIALVLAAYRTSFPDSQPGRFERHALVLQLLCAGVALAILFYMIWGPRDFWTPFIFGHRATSQIERK